MGEEGGGGGEETRDLKLVDQLGCTSTPLTTVKG